MVQTRLIVNMDYRQLMESGVNGGVIPMSFLNCGVSKLFWATGQGEATSHSHSYGEELQRRPSRSKWLRSP